MVVAVVFSVTALIVAFVFTNGPTGVFVAAMAISLTASTTALLLDRTR